MLGVDQGIEEKRDEIGKMVGMEMRKQNVGDLMAIHTALDQIHQRTRAKVQQHGVVRLDEIPGSGAGRVDIGAGTENGQMHELPIRSEHDEFTELFSLNIQAA